MAFFAVFLIELHGRWVRYYKRFFGFFREGSGWGTYAGSAFHLFPREMLDGRKNFLALACALALVSLYRRRRSPVELVGWILMLAASWFAYAYGYYKNQAGGGLHYFFPFFFFVWFLILHVLHVPRRRPSPFARAAISALVLSFLPWRDLVDRRKQVSAMQSEAEAFLTAVQARTGSEPILSEDLQLYKTRYQGETVDMGDTVAAIAGTGYFGRSFTLTFQAYEERTKSNPPMFVMAGIFNTETFKGQMSGALGDLLRADYDLVLKSPDCLVVNGVGVAALFERRAK
jgi:hypothetical protein